MPVTSKSFVRATILLLLFGFLCVLGIVAGALVLAGRNDSQADALIDVLEIRRDAFTVISLVQGAESGQRGYLLTQDPSYLQPYAAAKARIDEEMTKLRQAAESHPEYSGDINALDTRIDRKLQELDETVALGSSGDFEKAIAIVRTDRGEKAMNEVRSAATGLVRSTDALVAINTAALRASARTLVWVLAAGGALTLAIVGGMGWVAWRYTRYLEIARAEVLSLNATLESRVRERTADVARANEEIQRFAYIVSHDLRSPLVNVMGFTSELQTGLAAVAAFVEREAPAADDQVGRDAVTAVEEDLPEALSFIRSSTSRMDSLINAILKLSREGQRRLQPERVDMAALLEAVHDSVRHRLAETESTLEIVRPIPAIITDRLSVEQIFGNLVDNAVKYLDDERPGRIVVRARETAIGVELDVEDNGRGIADADHERIFDLFRRAGTQDRPGEGIGLSHVRALVRRLGGTISLRSKPGAGTTFTVKLPRILPPSQEGDET